MDGAGRVDRAVLRLERLRGGGRLRDRSVLGLTATAGRYAELVLSAGVTSDGINAVTHPLRDVHGLEPDLVMLHARLSAAAPITWDRLFRMRDVTAQQVFRATTQWMLDSGTWRTRGRGMALQRVYVETLDGFEKSLRRSVDPRVEFARELATLHSRAIRLGVFEPTVAVSDDVYRALNDLQRRSQRGPVRDSRRPPRGDRRAELMARADWPDTVPPSSLWRWAVHPFGW